MKRTVNSWEGKLKNSFGMEFLNKIFCKTRRNKCVRKGKKKSGIIKRKEKELSFHQVMCTVSYKKKFSPFLLSFLFSLKKEYWSFLFLFFTYKLRIFTGNENFSCCDADFFKAFYFKLNERNLNFKIQIHRYFHFNTCI